MSSFGIVEVVTDSFYKDGVQYWVCQMRCRFHQKERDPLNCKLCMKTYILQTRTLRQYVARQEAEGYSGPSYVIAQQGPRVKGLRGDPTGIYRYVRFVGCQKWEFALEETCSAVYV